MIKTKSFELAIYAKGDKNAGKLAIVIPGRLDTKDYAHNTSLVDTLAKKGYYALSFDPPGTWESPGDIGVYTTTNYIKAINELIDYFGNRPTLLAGHSRGGSVSVLSSDNPDVEAIVAILATYGPPTPPSPEAKSLGYHLTLRDLVPGDARTEQKKEFRLPLSYFDDGESYNPAEALKKFTKPKLLIYSDEDEFTDPQEVKDTYQALNGPKVLKKVHSTHDYRLNKKVVDEVNRLVTDFVDSLNK